MWIYEQADWPNLIWDAEAVAEPLAEVRHQQGRLLGRMEGLGFELRQEASLGILTSDVLKSSAIEGEHLDPQQIRSSIARRLGLDVGGLIPASRDVDGIVEVMLDATQGYDRPLSQERLFDWHAALFPTGRSGMQRIAVGAWRPAEAGPMQVASGPMGRERVHYEAPKADRLPHEMAAFLQWFEEGPTIDPVLKAGVAHFWFVTIHLFEDGNGRIARAIGDMALARADGMAERFYSASAQIEKERDHYYRQLELQQRGTVNITEFLLWFLECLGRAVADADHLIGAVLSKAKVWTNANLHPLNERQRSVLNRMLEPTFEGFMNTSKYAKLAKCSKDSALRDIQRLVQFNVLVANSGRGRSMSYRLVSDQE